MKKFAGTLFALLMCIASLGCVSPQKSVEGYYCDTDSYFESGGSAVDARETISYDSYTINDIFLDLTCPTYENLTQTNSCAPMAATIAIGYHDVTKPNLIPNYDPGWEWEGVYYFDSVSPTITSLKEHLYDLMGTNSVKPGTSESQFKNGMTSYVNGQGYSIEYKSCGSKFNINTAISYIQQQLPIVMLLNSYKYYNIGGITHKDNEAVMWSKTSPNGHVLVAFGYREYNYYKDGNIFRTDKYMIVSFGDGSEGLLLVNEIGCIDSAYAVNIY